MREYDVAIKLLIRDAADPVFRQLGMDRVTEWLNVELPKVQNPRVDLLGKTAGGQLVHIELQSRNDSLMPLRMAEYALAILRRDGKYPQQLVLYVGNGRLRMKPVLLTRGMRFHYAQLDIRQLDGRKLLESARISDNILGLLAGFEERTAAIQTVLKRIAGLKKERREEALLRLFLAADLRGLEDTVREESRKMPIIHRTSVNNKVFGPWIRKGIEEGLEKGLEKGLQEGVGRGRKEGYQRAVRFALKQRFGVLPADVTRRLRTLSERQAERLLGAVLGGKRLDELFPATQTKAR